MNKIFYKKVGRKFVAVSEYDNDLLDSLSYGDYLVSVYPGGSSLRKITPEFAPLIAAARYAEDGLARSIMDATDIRPTQKIITEEQRAAWVALSAAFGEDNHRLTWPAAADSAELVLSTLQDQAKTLLLNPAVKNAYDEFMLVVKLSKDQL